MALCSVVLFVEYFKFFHYLMVALDAFPHIIKVIRGVGGCASGLKK